MNTKFAWFLISSFILIGCSHEEKKKNIQKEFKEKDITQVIELKGNKIKFPSILNPYFIKNLKGNIIISEIQGDTLINIIDKKSNTIISKIGINGYGPGEINKPWNFYPTQTPNQFWVYTPETKTYHLFNINSVYPIKQFKQNEGLLMAGPLVWTKNQNFFAMESDTYEKFAIIDTIGNKLKSIGNWQDNMEEDISDFPVNALIDLHQGFLNVNKEGDQFIFPMLYKDEIEYFDMNTEKLITVKGPINHAPDYDIDYSAGYPMLAKDPKTTKYCYMGAEIGKDYIYALFSGNLISDVKKGLQSFAQSIYVFDLEGNVKIKYILDTSIMQFTLDQEEKKIYGISTDENPGIIIFDLP